MIKKERNNGNHPVLVLEVALGTNLATDTFPSLSASNLASMFFVHVIRFSDPFDGDPGACKQLIEDESFLSFGFNNGGGSEGDKKSAREERAKETSEGIGMGGWKDASLSVSLSLDKPRPMSGGRHNTAPCICSSFAFRFDLKSVANRARFITPLWQRTILSPVISSLSPMKLYVDPRGGRCLGRVYLFAIFDLFEMENDDC